MSWLTKTIQMLKAKRKINPNKVIPVSHGSLRRDGLLFATHCTHLHKFIQRQEQKKRTSTCLHLSEHSTHNVSLVQVQKVQTS